jgi:hypothetical protein
LTFRFGLVLTPALLCESFLVLWLVNSYSDSLSASALLNLPFLSITSLKVIATHLANCSFITLLSFKSLTYLNLSSQFIVQFSRYSSKVLLLLRTLTQLIA